jgi:hypothetical protein
MTGEAKKWWRDFATWATKEQALKNLTELVLEVNEMLDEILPPLLAEQKRSGNSLVKPKPSTLALTADEPTVLIPIEQLEFIQSQCEDKVLPAARQYVLPSKRFANLVLDGAADLATVEKSLYDAPARVR